MSPLVLYTTAALMAIVAVACTGLCLLWSKPSWRLRLGRRGEEVPGTQAKALSGWPARIGSGLISTGIAACAGVAWYGCYCVLTASNAANP
jgi:hypothetical protein